MIALLTAVGSTVVVSTTGGVLCTVAMIMADTTEVLCIHAY